MYIRRGNKICVGELGKTFYFNRGFSFISTKNDFSSILKKKSIQYRIESKISTPEIRFQICGIFVNLEGKSRKKVMLAGLPRKLFGQYPYFVQNMKQIRKSFSTF